MKLFISLIILLSFSSLSTFAKALKSEPRVIHFKAAHGPYEVILKPLTVFKEEVEKLTEGRVRVELIIPHNLEESNKASTNKTFNELLAGKVEMSQLYTSYMSRFDKDFLALEIPYILKDHQHSFNVVDGEIGQSLQASLEQKSPLMALGFTYCGGNRMVATSTKKILAMEDFKTLKVNTDSPMSKSALEELGVQVGTDVSKEHLMNYIAAKKTDGHVAAYPRYFHWDEYKTAPIVNALDFNIQFTVLLINKEFFHTLSKKDQEIIKFAAKKASAKERQTAIDVATEVITNAPKYKIEVVKMPADQKTKLVETLNKVDWSQKHGISKEIIRKIRNLSEDKLTYLGK